MPPAPPAPGKPSPDPTRGRSLPDAAKTFLTRLHKARGRSLLTVAAYAGDLERYFSFLRGKGLGYREVRRAHMEEFVEALDGTGTLGKRSINRTLSAVKSFYKWLNDTEAHPNSVRDWVESPKFQGAAAVPLTEEETRQLLRAIQKNPLGKPREAWFQDLVTIRMLYATGMRLMDLVRLLPGDLDLGQNQLLVSRSKGGKSRWVDIDDGTKILLQEFLNRFTGGPRDPLFRNPRRSRYSPAGLRRSLENAVKAYARAAGIKKRVYPHLLRHSCAVHMLNNNADLKAIQDLLGHSHISTTQVYLQMSNQHRKKQYRSSHPLAKN